MKKDKKFKLTLNKETLSNMEGIKGGALKYTLRPGWSCGDNTACCPIKASAKCNDQKLVKPTLVGCRRRK